MVVDSRLLFAASLVQSVVIVNGIETARELTELNLDGYAKATGCAADRCVLWANQVSDDCITAEDANIGDGYNDVEFLEIVENYGWVTATDKDVLCQSCLSPPTGTVVADPDGNEANIYEYVRNDLNCQGVQDGDEKAAGRTMQGEEGFVTFWYQPGYKLVDALFWSEDGSKKTDDYDYYCVNNFENYLDPCCLESSVPSSKPTTAAPTLAPTIAEPSNPCFSEIATVEVQGKGKVTMKSLQVGDLVLTPSGYEKVYTIDHRSENKLTDFIQIHTEIGEPLQVTGTHLLFMQGKHDPVEARTIIVGDELQGFFDGEMKTVVVEKISSISKHGLYNPITSSGTIVVDGLVTSTYTAVNVSNGSNYLTMGGYKVLSMHDFIHLAMAPFKTICCMPLPDATTNKICSVSEEKEHNSYNQLGLKLMAYGKGQTIFVQNAILFVLMSLFLSVGIVSSPLFLISLILFKTMKKQTKID